MAWARADESGGWVVTVQRAAAAPWVPLAGAGLLGLAAVGEVLAHAPGSGLRGPFVLVLCLVALASTLPVMVTSPTLAAAVVAGAAVLALTGFHALTVAGFVAQVFAAYRLGRAGSPPVAVAIGVPFLVVALAGSSTVQEWAVLLAALLPTAALTGSAERVRREARASSAARRAIAGSLVEHTARGERARIARELHDVVAHHISMITVQAESARLTTPGMPDAGARQLSAIGDTARSALTEMRRLLGVLREDAHGDPTARQPQPGLRQLNELLDEARDSSRATTRLIRRGHPATLDPGVELAAYRIVQESLTNSRRHAPGAAVDVELHYTGEVLQLLVRDNGPGVGGPVPAQTHGLLGMRERAAAVGGRLRAGPAAGGGFLVEATLPTAGRDAR